MTLSLAARAEEIEQKYAGRPVGEVMRALITTAFPGRIALVSSFGTEAAVLLHFAAQADRGFPVIFLDTQKLFPETLAYRDTLIDHFGLTNVSTLYPDYTDTIRSDPDGNLWQNDGRACCTIRKVKPLARALKGYDAWITGRKRFHGGVRSHLPFCESAEGRIKINPLAGWTPEAIDRVFKEQNIPPHPLAEKGYTSVGCVPCTDRPDGVGGPRSGRWKGQDRTECGIHLENGRFVRTNVT